MVQLRLIVRLLLLTTLQTAECSYDGLGAMSQGRKMSKASERGEYPIYPLNTVYVPYRGSIPNLLLSTTSVTIFARDPTECQTIAANYGDHYWHWSSDCYVAKLDAPVCRVENEIRTGYRIMESFLTDGSPNDDLFPSTVGINRFMRSQPNVAFRVMTPTILEFPEFTTEIAFVPPEAGYDDIKLPLTGKIFVFPKLGGIVATDDSILVDPSCHTNNSCGVAFLSTSVEAITAPHVALDEYCGQTIDLNDTPVFNVFSHAGIGCKLFSDVYTTPNCELTITSPSPFTANVTLVNFRKATCGGYELKLVNFTYEGISKEVDVCQENAPTVFHSSEGKMQIKLTGSASENWHRYGFIIRLEKVTKNDDSSKSSSVNSVQVTSEDAPQFSTTAPAESPTNSPVQNSADECDVDFSDTSQESSSETEFISDPTESFESKSPSVSSKSSTNQHHLHLMLALGIDL